MKRAMIVAAAALLAAACQPVAADPGAGLGSSPMVDEIDTTDVPPAVRVPERTEAADCEARGGRMTPQGRMQTLQCVVSYADAGKRCTDGDDCQGDCRVENAPFPAAGASAVGRCQADSGRFGCHATVENGRAGPAICID